MIVVVAGWEENKAADRVEARYACFGYSLVVKKYEALLLKIMNC